MTKYLESLPKGCPPNDAEEINEHQVVYRLVETNPPTGEDFKSFRALGKTSDRADDCIAHGVSVYGNIKDAENLLGSQRFQESFICHVQLSLGAGSIKKTGRKSHYTWWPYASYNILRNCHLIQP